MTAKAGVYEYSNQFPTNVPSGTLAYSRNDCKLYIRDNCENGCGGDNGWVELPSTPVIFDLLFRIENLEKQLKEVKHE